MKPRNYLAALHLYLGHSNYYPQIIHIQWKSRENHYTMKSCIFGSQYRGCLIIIWTGLNIKIGIVQKVYEWSSCPFAKMIPRLENHFGKIPAWSLIYLLFELCLFWYLAQSKWLWDTLYLQLWSIMHYFFHCCYQKS